MTPLSALLDRIGWTVPHLAGRLGLAPQTVFRWHRGRNTRGNPSAPPGAVLTWLERVADAIERYPPPPHVPTRGQPLTWTQFIKQRNRTSTPAGDVSAAPAAGARD